MLIHFFAVRFSEFYIHDNSVIRKVMYYGCVVAVCSVPAANAPGYTAGCRLIVNPLVLDVPTCTRQVSFTSQRR